MEARVIPFNFAGCADEPSPVYYHSIAALTGDRSVIRYNTDRNQWQQWSLVECAWYDLIGQHNLQRIPDIFADVRVMIVSYETSWCEATLD